VVVAEADRRRALERAEKERHRMEGAEILWVDDHPSNNRNEVRMLGGFGGRVTFACTTEEALEAIQQGNSQRRGFDLVVSDIARDWPKPNARAGLEMLNQLHGAGVSLPVIFYVGQTDPGAGTPPGAFALCYRPDHLLEFILDALARVRNP
jgi:CheY-like chemotaxis protein